MFLTNGRLARRPAGFVFHTLMWAKSPNDFIESARSLLSDASAYCHLQKLLTKRVTVKRMRAGNMRQPKNLIIYAESANRNLSITYCYLVFCSWPCHAMAMSRQVELRVCYTTPAVF